VLGLEVVMPLFSVCHEAAAIGSQVNWGGPAAMPTCGPPIFACAEDIRIPDDLLLRPGCAVPLANLLWAPVFVIELATIEDHYARLRRPIVQWWIVWVFSYVVSIFAMVTSFATEAQGIANNTVLMVSAYLLAAATVAAVARVFEGFERKPVERPAHRWVVIGDGGPAVPASAGRVELQGEEPAA